MNLLDSELDVVGFKRGIAIIKINYKVELPPNYMFVERRQKDMNWRHSPKPHYRAALASVCLDKFPPV
jgi:hypothetical protein